MDLRDRAVDPPAIPHFSPMEHELLLNGGEAIHKLLLIQKLQDSLFLSTRFISGEDAISLLQGSFRADVVPESWNPPGVDRHLGIEPLNEPARLVGVIALGNILTNARHR